MFSEYASAKHKEQAEEFLLSLGKLVLAFERVCAAMRFLVLFVLNRHGLNQPMAQVIIGTRERAHDLRNLLAALLVELPGLDDDDRKAAESLMQRIAGLTKKRNKLVHANWDFGTAATESELATGTWKFKAEPSRGVTIQQYWSSSSEIEEDIRKARQCQVLLDRLQICLTQAGFKVSTELGRAL